MSAQLLREKMMSMWFVLGILVLLTFRGCTVDAQIGGIPATTTTVEVLSEAYTHGDSGSSMYSAYGYLKCTLDQIHAPTTTEEVSAVVRKLVQAVEALVKVRVSRRGYHSPAGFVCPGRRASTKFPAGESSHDEYVNGSTSVILLLHSMNRVVSVDVERRRLTVESGMTLQDLVDAAEENGMTVPSSALPIYGNLTIGGVIATSAHGSGAHPVSTLGSLVTRARWVNGKGEILVSDVETENGAEEITALVGGMGLLGIITEVTFQLEPTPSLTMVEIRNDLDDAHIAADVKKVLEDETPFVILHWRPDFGKYRTVLYTPLKAGEMLPASAPPLHPKARSAFMSAVPDDIAGYVKATLSAWENDPLEASLTADVTNAGICGLSKGFIGAPFFVDEEDGTFLDNVTLPTNRAMLAAECTPKCVYQTQHMGAGLKDVAFTLKLSQLEDFVADLKAIVAAEMVGVQDQLDSRYGQGKVTVCMPPGNFWFRFGGKSNSLLSTNAGDEDVVYIQWTPLEAAVSVPEKHQKSEAVLQTYEQLMLCKYKARPHWGKNYERVFRHPKCHVRQNYPESNIVKMLEMQQRHDPKKMFEPQLFTQVLEMSGPSYYPRCASALWCYCEEDVHCPIGNVCRPSPVFPEYKICRLDTNLKHQLHHDEL